MKIRMPEDGWDNREITYYCPFCDRNLIHKSVYLNMDALIEMGVTQAEFALNIHLNDHNDLVYNLDTQQWERKDD